MPLLITAPFRTKTNGIVKRLNEIIKTNTILKNHFADTLKKKLVLSRFKSFYNQQRRHGSLRKDLKAKMPCWAIKKWQELNPEIFKIKPYEFIENIIFLQTELAYLHQ